MKKLFRSYKVWPRFPSVSISGNTCALHCKHCNQQYLNDMEQLSTPDQLYHQCVNHYQNGAVGILLSGGCDTKGRMLNLQQMLPTIQRIKQETSLILKLHTGLVDNQLAEDIVSAGIDIASIEVVGDASSIKEIFSLNASPIDYEHSLQALEQAGMPYIVPHICIGLYYGQLKGEYTALDIIQRSCTPSTIVFIVFRPTKNTPLATTPPPVPDDVFTVITKGKTLFPETELALGCIRPRTKKRVEIEHAAVTAGVTRMELPSKTTLNTVQQLGFTIKTIEACCAVPQAFESYIEKRSVTPPSLRVTDHEPLVKNQG